jgi:hypothetical protein
MQLHVAEGLLALDGAGFCDHLSVAVGNAPLCRFTRMFDRDPVGERPSIEEHDRI